MGGGDIGEIGRDLTTFWESLVTTDIAEGTQKVSIKLTADETRAGQRRESPVTYRPNNLTFIQSVATRVRFRREKRLLR